MPLRLWDTTSVSNPAEQSITHFEQGLKYRILNMTTRFGTCRLHEDSTAVPTRVLQRISTVKSCSSHAPSCYAHGYSRCKPIVPTAIEYLLPLKCVGMFPKEITAWMPWIIAGIDVMPDAMDLSHSGRRADDGWWIEIG